MLSEILETERLILRPFNKGDLSDIMDYATDPKWSKYLPVPQPYTSQSAIEFLELQVSLDRVNNPNWAIQYQNKVVGGINVRFFFDKDRAELGYSISPVHWGKGLATEAARKIIDLCFEGCLNLNRISANADSRNKGSLKVMEKLGMTVEGTLRQNRKTRDEYVDEAWCGLLRSEWLAAKGVEVLTKESKRI